MTDTPREHWRTIPDFDDYEISNHGNIRRRVDGQPGYLFGDPNRPIPTRYPAGTPITTRLGTHGYPECNLTKDGQHYRRTVHKLVALTWIGQPPTPAHEVGHKDGNRANPRANNLEWITRSTNHHQTWAMGRRTPAGYCGRTGPNNPSTKLTPDQVRQLRADYTEIGPQWTELGRRYNLSPPAARAVALHLTHQTVHP